MARGLSMQVTGHDTKYFTDVKKRVALRTLAIFTGAGYGMSISGLGDPESTRNIRLSAGPHTIWTSAFLYETVKDGRSLKNGVDVIAQSGALVSACLRYGILSEIIKEAPSLQEILRTEDTDEAGRDALMPVFRRSLALRWDIIFSEVDVWLRLRLTKPAEEAIAKLVEPSMASLLTLRQWHHAWRLQALVHLAERDSLEPSDLDEVLNHLELVKSHMPSEHVNCDMEVLKEVKAACSGEVSQHASFASGKQRTDMLLSTIPAAALSKLDGLSIYTLPFQPYDTEYTAQEEWPIDASELLGWQNV